MKGFGREGHEGRRASQYYALRLLSQNDWDKLDPIVRKRAEMMPGGPMRITSVVMPLAFEGLVYSRQVQTIGGFGAKTFSIVSGVLPTGLSISSSGLVTGTPAAASEGVYPVVIRVVDSRGSETENTVSFEVLNVGLYLQPDGVSLYYQPNQFNVYIQP